MANKLPWEVQFDLEYNHRSPKEILIGTAAREYLSEKSKHGLTDSRVEEFFSNVVKLYRQAATYIKENLPFHDPFMRHMQITLPECITRDGMLSTSLPYLMDRFPCLLQGWSKDDLLSQFADLQTEPMDGSILRLDNFWASVADKHGERFKGIATFLLHLLTIPHSSAHCERVFSCVRKTKTDFRAALGQETLEALMIMKHATNKLDYSIATLRHLKGSTSRALGQLAAQ